MEYIYIIFHIYYIYLFIHTIYIYVCRCIYTHIYFFFLADWSASQDTDWECQVSIFLFPLTWHREIRPKGSPLKVLWEVFVFWERERERYQQRERVFWFPGSPSLSVFTYCSVPVWICEVSSLGPWRWQNRERKPTQWGQLKGKL